jgi:hypothetical protein
MNIQIDGKRSATTDKNGRYELSANEGQHRVVLLSSELGVRLLATTPTANIVAHRRSVPAAKSPGRKNRIDCSLRERGGKHFDRR